MLTVRGEIKNVNRIGSYVNFTTDPIVPAGTHAQKERLPVLVWQIETNGISHIASIDNGSKQWNNNFYIDTFISFTFTKELLQGKWSNCARPV